VQVLQRDAIDRLQLQRLLLEPEMLAAVEPDVHLVATILELGRLLPDTARATARQVVGKVVDQIEARLASRTRAAVAGALDRSSHTRRPRPRDIDWDRTIHANLRHYQPQLRTVIPERLVGHGRREHAIDREVVIAIDQSGSMADSIVYAGVFSSVLASMKALRTSVVAFDTNVVDLTAHLQDPLDILFGVQLGGGTDLDAALAYCESLISRPADTVLVLLSDLYDAADSDVVTARVSAMVRSGVTCVALLALADSGAPVYDHRRAAALSAVGATVFACTPEAFPDLLAAAIERRDLTQWANAQGFLTPRPVDVW
jgi:Mg-chelatase subunit ChlD